MAVWPILAAIRPDVRAALEADALYAGYMPRQEADIAAWRRDEALALPLDLDYAAIGCLSTEECQALNRVRPLTLGAAGRIPNVTPASLMALLRYVKKG